MRGVIDVFKTNQPYAFRLDHEDTRDVCMDHSVGACGTAPWDGFSARCGNDEKSKWYHRSRRISRICGAGMVGPTIRAYEYWGQSTEI